MSEYINSIEQLLADNRIDISIFGITADEVYKQDGDSMWVGTAEDKSYYLIKIDQKFMLLPALQALKRIRELGHKGFTEKLQ